MGPLIQVISSLLSRPDAAAHLTQAARLVNEVRQNSALDAEVKAGAKARADAAATARAQAEAEASEFAARGRTFSVAVLGESEVGKTSLINSWQGIAMPESLRRTQAPRSYGDITVTTSGGDRLTFRGTVDVGGHTWNLPWWDKLVNEGRWVLYLVDARQITTAPRSLLGDLGRTPRRRSSLDRLEEDADRIFKAIRARENAADIPEVGTIVVVTHTDLVPGWSADPVGSELRIRKELDRTILLLGGDRRVRLVCGSLADLARAQQLTDRIAEHLLRWEP
jgi:hypothetical protein